MYTIQRFNIKTSVWEWLQMTDNFAVAETMYGNALLRRVMNNENHQVVLGFRGTDEELVARYYEVQFA
jgi:hypothetical protein